MVAAMSTQFYNRAPVYVVDPEAAWQFLKRRIFDVEGIELIQRTYSTFKDREFRHELSRPRTSRQRFRGARRDTQKRRDEDQAGKVGTKFKACGGESFGYEPHLLLELSLERKNRKVHGQEREGEGRMVHRADALRERTWALNGRTFRWTDKAKYEAGGYRQVWYDGLALNRQIRP
jgi:hypothetical protein